MKKFRVILSIFMVLSMLLAAGCSKGSAAAPERKYEIVKMTKVHSQDAEWQVCQLRLEIGGGSTFTIDLNLADGDKVDCWYKLEKPSSSGNVGFQVKAGAAIVYEKTVTTASDGNTEDRFSFTASQAFGTSYRLIFENKLTDVKSKETIFTEIIYPVKESSEDIIFVPLDTD
ncbi:MAG: hypothetical protein JW856_01310 [Dehalococcoidales bacterium]|nr:hypothetical protein [Dehalococcoidales bacterium]